MSSAEMSFSTAVLFGEANVQKAPTFTALAGRLAKVLEGISVPFRIRGYISDSKGRNVAPRSACLTTAAVNRWTSVLGKGRFLNVGLYDTIFSDATPPRAYAGFAKLWDYRDHRYTDHTRLGARCCVTLAIRRTLNPKGSLGLERIAQELVKTIGAVYGFLEDDVPWVSRVECRGGDRPIDLRWRDVSVVDYGDGAWEMRRYLPRLYRGNVLLPTHFKGSQSVPYLERIESWGNNLRYVRLARDPQWDESLQGIVARSFNIIPRGK